jgi:hypothetical protein
MEGRAGRRHRRKRPESQATRRAFRRAVCAVPIGATLMGLLLTVLVPDDAQTGSFTSTILPPAALGRCSIECRKATLNRGPNRLAPH